MKTIIPTVPTIGVIARRTGKPVHCVDYVIKTRNIKPIGRAGNANIYSEADVAHIASELCRIDEERQWVQS